MGKIWKPSSSILQRGPPWRQLGCQKNYQRLWLHRQKQPDQMQQDRHPLLCITPGMLRAHQQKGAIWQMGQALPRDEVQVLQERVLL